MSWTVQAMRCALSYRLDRSRSVFCKPSSFPESAEASAACAPFPCLTASSFRRAPSTSCAAVAMSVCASSQARSARRAFSSLICPPVRPGSALARSTSVAAVRPSPFFPAFRAQPPSRSNSQRSRAFCSSNSVSAGGFSPAGTGMGPYALSVAGNGAVPVGKKRPRSITNRLPWALTRKRCWLRSDASHPTAPSSARITSQSKSRWNAPPLRGACSAMAQYADEGDVAVLVIGVQTVTHDEAILDLEAQIVDGNPGARPRRLVQERAELHRRRPPRGHVVEQIAHRQPGIADVLDDHHVLALDGPGEVARDLDDARRLGGLAVAREPDEVDAQGQIDRARQVGDEDVGALQHAEHDQLLALVVPLDLRSQLLHPPGDPVCREHRLQLRSEFQVVSLHICVVHDFAEAAAARHDVLLVVEAALAVPVRSRHGVEDVLRGEAAIEPQGIDDGLRGRAGALRQA